MSTENYRPLISRQIKEWLGSETGTKPVVAVAFGINALVTGQVLSSASLPIDLKLSPLVQDLIHAISVAIVFTVYHLFSHRSLDNVQQLARNLWVWIVAAGLSSISTPLISSYLQDSFLLGQIWEISLIGFLANLLILMIFTVVIAAYRELRAVSRELATARHRLLIIRDKVNGELIRSRSILQNQVNQSLIPLLTAIEEKFHSEPNQLESNLEATKDLVRTTIDGVVRPLSHKLVDSPMHFGQLTADVDELRKEIAVLPVKERLLRTVSLSNAFLPKQLFVLLLVFEAASIYVLGGLHNFVSYGLPATLVATSTIFGAKTVFRKLRLPFLFAISSAMFVSLLASAVFIVFAKYSSISTELAFGFAASTYVVATVLSYFGLLIDRRLSLLADARIVNQEINDAIKSLRTEVALARKHAARIMHGTVQARLQSILLRIRNEGELTDEVVGQVRDDIQKAREQIELVDASVTMTLGQSVDDLIDFWDGVCEIHTNLTQELDEMISEAPVAEECIREVLVEAVSNAIKHASVKVLEIDFQLTNERALVLTVSHDSSRTDNQDLVDIPRGFGIRIYDELTNSWTLEQIDNRVVFSARFSLN